VSDLNQQHSISVEQGLTLLNSNQIDDYLTQLDGWQCNNASSAIEKEFRFRDFYQTIAFVNAVAWIANQENHHPDLQLGYNRCLVSYTTHDVDGLSLNDFICAAKIDTLNR
jgi:4a-hydroxytetrahydrobiopterin dehydratase